MRIILASASPRRRELIQKIENAEIIVRPSACAERTDKTLPHEVVKDLSAQKAADVSKDFPDDIVLGADTVVALDGIIYGKPKSKEDAYRIIKTLSGRTHEVYTGATIIKGSKVRTFFVKSEVTFKEFDEKAVRDYIASGIPMDKAGAYGIQDKEFAPMVESYSGSLDNIIGLPTEEILRELKENYDY